MDEVVKTCNFTSSLPGEENGIQSYNFDQKLRLVTPAINKPLPEYTSEDKCILAGWVVHGSMVLFLVQMLTWQ
jgi:hypothetical protein